MSLTSDNLNLIKRLLQPRYAGSLTVLSKKISLFTAIRVRYIAVAR